MVLYKAERKLEQIGKRALRHWRKPCGFLGIGAWCPLRGNSFRPSVFRQAGWMVTTLLATVIIGGCAVKRVPPTLTYEIDTQTSSVPKAQVPLFDSLRLVVIPGSKSAISTAFFYRLPDHRLQPYAYHRWAETPRQMMTQKLLFTLQQSGIARHALPAQAKGSARYTLQIDLLTFRQTFNDQNRSLGKIGLLATLVDDRNARIVASKLFEADAPAPIPDAPGGVKALNRAADKITEDILKWLKEVVSIPR